MELNDTQHDMLAAKLQIDIDAGDTYYEGEIEPLVMERTQVFKSEPEFYKKMFPSLSRFSSLTSSDVADTIESAMPSLMKLFFGSQDVITLQGVTAEDDENAKIMQDLINFQLQRKNSAYMIFMNWFKDALITNAGIVKCSWERETKIVPQSITISYDMLEEFQAQEDVTIKNVELDQLTGNLYVDFEGPRLVKNQPIIENVPASEFRFSPDCNNLDEADFVAHRKIVSVDYLRKRAKQGWYDKKRVEQVAEKASNPEYTVMEEENNNYLANRKFSDKGRRKVAMYECYVKMSLEDNEDDELKDYIVTCIDGIIIRIEENTYERHPFFMLTPIIDTNRIFPTRGISEAVAQLQHLKTAVIRQIVHNIALSNNPKYGIDVSQIVDVNDIIENKQLIRVKGPVGQAITPLPNPPLQPWTFELLNYVDEKRSVRSGITKYTQGTDGNELNKTATGISIISQAANARLELIARTFSETGVSQLFRFLITLNQKFIDEDMVVRLTNKELQVRADDIAGEFDLVVNAAMGSGSKQDSLMMAQQLIAIVEKLYMGGFADYENIYNAATKLLEELGIKNTDDYLMTLEEYQQKQMAQMGVQMGGMTGGAIDPTGGAGVTGGPGTPGVQNPALPPRMAGMATSANPNQII